MTRLSRFIKISITFYINFLTGSNDISRRSRDIVTDKFNGLNGIKSIKFRWISLKIMIFLTMSVQFIFSLISLQIHSLDFSKKRSRFRDTSILRRSKLTRLFRRISDKKSIFHFFIKDYDFFFLFYYLKVPSRSAETSNL